jgi:tetratricopeptide (TPR) repeat protein
LTALVGKAPPEIDFLRGMWLAQSQRLEKAADVLAPHVNALAPAALHRMEIDLQLRRLNEARRDARAVRAHLEAAEREALRRGATPDADLYRQWEQAERLVGDRAAHARIARRWLAVAPNSPAARQAVAEVSAGELDELMESLHPDADSLAARLVELATVVGDAPALEQQVQKWFRARRQSPPLAAMFERIAMRDDAPAALAAAVGTAAALGGEIEMARTMLARAVTADEGRAAAWNNYAWALAQPPAADADKALAAANRAVALAPEEFHFRETRGQILVALGQWQKAVDDLEYALNAMPEAASIHAALAKAYEELALPELAEAHRQQIP